MAPRKRKLPAAKAAPSRSKKHKATRATTARAGAAPLSRSNYARLPNELALRICGNLDPASIVNLLRAHGCACCVDARLVDARGRTPLLVAAEKGHLDVVKHLVESTGAALDAKSAAGWTPLRQAVTHGHHAVVEFLIEKRAAVNPVKRKSKSALHYAAEEGRLGMVRLLVEKGRADVEGKDYQGWRPLYYAAKKGHLAVAEYLIEKGARLVMDNLDLPSDAFMHGQLDVVKLLISKGAASNVDVFHRAAHHGKLALVKYLVEEVGVAPDAENRRGRTAFHQAVDALVFSASRGYPKRDATCLEVVQYLLQKAPAAATVGDHNQTTPLHIAASFGRLDCVELLVNEGRVDVNARDSSGGTPLFSAVGGACSFFVIDFLVERGADINAENNAGHTPLSVAVGARNFGLVGYLLALGAEARDA